jgi:hypothetical protein
VVDPDTNALIEMAVYKHENGGMFALDTSYIEQVIPDEDDTIYDPFSTMGDPNELYLIEE